MHSQPVYTEFENNNNKTKRKEQAIKKYCINPTPNNQITNISIFSSDFKDEKATIFCSSFIGKSERRIIYILLPIKNINENRTVNQQTMSEVSLEEFSCCNVTDMINDVYTS